MVWFFKNLFRLISFSDLSCQIKRVTIFQLNLRRRVISQQVELVQLRSGMKNFACKSFREVANILIFFQFSHIFLSFSFTNSLVTDLDSECTLSFYEVDNKKKKTETLLSTFVTRVGDLTEGEIRREVMEIPIMKTRLKSRESQSSLGTDNSPPGLYLFLFIKNSLDHNLIFLCVVVDRERVVVLSYRF